MSPDVIEAFLRQGIVEASDIDPDSGYVYFPDAYYYYQWKEQRFHDWTDLQWVIHMGVKGQIRAKIKEYERKLADAVAQKRRASGDQWQAWVDKIEGITKAIRTLNIGLGNSHNTINVEVAKQSPIIDILQVNRQGFALCPLHQEKTPSLKVYKNNSWYCFGCNNGGDVIDLVMQMDKVDFPNAVRRLT